MLSQIPNWVILVWSCTGALSFWCLMKVAWSNLPPGTAGYREAVEEQRVIRQLAIRRAARLTLLSPLVVPLSPLLICIGIVGGLTYGVALLIKMAIWKQPVALPPSSPRGPYR